MSWIRKVLGISLMFFSAIGVVLCAAGIVVTPRVTSLARAEVVSLLDLADRSLTVADDSLDIISGALEQSGQAITNVDSLLTNVGDTLAGFDPTFEEAQTFTGEDMPAMITATQAALATAEESAAVVDTFLYGINTISFLTGVEYAPEKSLAESILDVSTSLSAIPESLEGLDEGITAARQGLTDIGADLDNLSANLGEMSANVTDAQELVIEFDALIQEVDAEVEELRGQVQRGATIATAVLIIALIWMAITQAGLFFQGWEMAAQKEPVAKLTVSGAGEEDREA